MEDTQNRSDWKRSPRGSFWPRVRALVIVALQVPALCVADPRRLYVKQDEPRFSANCWATSNCFGFSLSKSKGLSRQYVSHQIDSALRNNKPASFFGIKTRGHWNPAEKGEPKHMRQDRGGRGSPQECTPRLEPTPNRHAPTSSPQRDPKIEQTL